MFRTVTNLDAAQWLMRLLEMELNKWRAKLQPSI